MSYYTLSIMTIQSTRGITTSMIIMGIDPGVARVGWSIIQTQGATIQALAFGCIETDKEKNPQTRLAEIYDQLQVLLRKHLPECMVVEELFFSTNVKTAMGVGQARGVVLLTAAKANVPVVSYSPLTVKRAITGDGKADKKQISRMVVLTLRLTQTPKLDDTTDALAIAMTHAYSHKIKQLV
jgi:crossover junction endodeoxyribonuclease RuvC